jgi:uncharacterized Tic20 family protein
MRSHILIDAVAPTPGERILAALAHLSILGGGLGLFVPALVWVAKRQKSAFTSFQALQALGYAIFAILYEFLLVPVWLIVFILLNISVIVTEDGTRISQEYFTVIQDLIIMITIMMILPLLLGIIGALACLFGKEFRYPILGNHLAVYLQHGRAEGIDPEYEDRFVSAVVHACVMFVSPTIPYYIAAPLVALLYSKGRSQLLHFQSLQALVFQLLGTAISFGFLMVMAGLFVSAMIFSSINPATGTISNSSNTPALILFLAATLILLIFLLFLPVIQTFGLVAGYRVLKGKDYEYPLVGKLVKGWSWI